MTRLLRTALALCLMTRVLIAGLSTGGPVDGTTDQERAQIMQMSQAELQSYLISGHGGETGRQLAVLRLSATPHWTATWGFWVTVLACLFAAIAAWPVLKATSKRARRRRRKT